MAAFPTGSFAGRLKKAVAPGWVVVGRAKGGGAVAAGVEEGLDVGLEQGQVVEGVDRQLRSEFVDAVRSLEVGEVPRAKSGTRVTVEQRRNTRRRHE